jgi:hypothetical protein
MQAAHRNAHIQLLLTLITIITISSRISAMTSVTIRKKMKGKKFLTSNGGKVVSPSRLTADKLRVICTMGSTAHTNANRIAK